MSGQIRAMIVTMLLGWMFALSASAGVKVTLPLGGYYRPGKFMPVRVEAEGVGGQIVEISAEGAAPTRIGVSGGRVSGVFPWLGMEMLNQPGWRVHGGESGIIAMEMKPLSMEQRLVGFVMADAGFAQSLFGEASVIPIQLDPADPLPGRAIGWESLDAVILNGLPAKWDDQTVNTFLSAGMVIAVRSANRPDPRWPWKQRGAYWVLSYVPTGPTRSGEDPRMFEPVAGWMADWPKSYRMRVILIAVVMSILILGGSLWRNRWAWVVVVAICAGGALGMGVWRKGRSPVLVRMGTVIVDGGELRQYDWLDYFASASQTRTRVPLSESTRLFFETRADWLAARPVLHLSVEGLAEMEVELYPGITIARLSRSVMHEFETLRLTADETSPMARLAKRVYIRPGDQLTGEEGVDMTNEARSEQVEEFSAVIVRRRVENDK